jgi:hypothetical protein
MRLIATMAVVGTLATVGVARADDEPAVAPEQAQAIGLAVTAAGLLGSAYLWQTAGGLPADDGRDERRMLAAGAATLTLGVGPMAGLWAGGARRRAVLGGATRPAMIVVGGWGGDRRAGDRVRLLRDQRLPRRQSPVAADRRRRAAGRRRGGLGGVGSARDPSWSRDAAAPDRRGAGDRRRSRRVAVTVVR